MIFLPYNVLGLVTLIAVLGFCIFLIVIASLGAMHQHLRNRGEAFGNGVTPRQLQEQLDATLTTNNSEDVIRH